MRQCFGIEYLHSSSGFDTIVFSAAMAQNLTTFSFQPSQTKVRPLARQLQRHDLGNLQRPRQGHSKIAQTIACAGSIALLAAMAFSMAAIDRAEDRVQDHSQAGFDKGLARGFTKGFSAGRDYEARSQGRLRPDDHDKGCTQSLEAGGEDTGRHVGEQFGGGIFDVRKHYLDGFHEGLAAGKTEARSQGRDDRDKGFAQSPVAGGEHDAGEHLGGLLACLLLACLPA